MTADGSVLMDFVSLTVAIETGEAAQAAGDVEHAVGVFAAARRQFPDSFVPGQRQAAALMQLGRFDEADAVLRDTLRHFPDEAGLAIDRAWVAQRRGDYADAARRWGHVRAQFPDFSVAYTAGAVCLRELRQLDEAEALLAEAMARFPDDPSPSIEHAWVAHARRDWSAAAQRWEVVHSNWPNIAAGFTGAAVALRELGQMAEAEAVLQDAVSRFPDDAGAAIEYAWTAHFARNWTAAVSRWEEVRAKLPSQPAGFTGGATALRELGRLAEAEALLQEAAERFPNQPGPAIELAWLKVHRRDWDAALSLLTDLRARFPDHAATYVGAALALRELGHHGEADELLNEAIERFPHDPSPRVNFAWLAQVARDWPAAVDRWAAVRERHPDNADSYVQAARALAELWRHEEAERLLEAAMERLPGAAEPAVQHAWAAYQQNRLDDAAARFAALRARFPDQPDGWIGGALVLRNASRLTAAEQLLAEGVQRLPNQPRVALEHAQLPVFPVFAEQKNWPETLRRMAVLRDRFPEFEQGWLTAVRLLRQAGRNEEAEDLARRGSERIPASTDLAVEYARAAEERADWPEAVRRYTALKRRFPTFSGSDLGLARALAGTGRHDEAEALVQDAMARVPNDPAPFATYAQFATDRQDWAAAHRRWSDAHHRFPAEKDFAHRVFDTQMRLSESEPSTIEQAAFAGLEPAPKPDPASIDTQVSELVAQFESLGGRGLGCEFGIVQRDCGAEPLGLLRWADMPYDMLLFALDSDFEGVGTRENTELFTTAIGGGRAEYCTRDRRGMMFMRGFIYEDEVPFEKMYAAACRRLQLLTRRLIDDLRNGSKIFVFRLTDRNLTDAEIDRLHAAVRRYGDNMLLYARYEDAAHPNGTVELVRPGLVIGYMDRFKMSAAGELYAAPPTSSWLAVCKSAYALWMEHARDAVELPAPRVKKAGTATIILCGHQVHQLRDILLRLRSLRDRVRVHVVDPSLDFDTVRRQVTGPVIADAGVYWEESHVGHGDAKERLRENIPRDCDIRTFPSPRLTALWPFLGADPRQSPDPPLYNGGRYAFTDRIAAELATQDLPDDFLFDLYMERCAAELPDLDAMFSADLAAWRKADETFDVKIAEFIQQTFPTDRPFASPVVRGPILLGHYARQLLNTPGMRALAEPEALAAELDSVLTGYVGTRQELPVNPLAARHFDLAWWSSDMRYRLGGNRQTFREYVIDYLRWCPWLP
jgi:tetratricopeptide (TPR) repeat protein